MAFGYPHQKTLVYGIPLTGRPLPPDIMFGFSACSAPMNTNVLQYKLIGWPIDKARNQFAKWAIENKAEYLFFWDEDVLLHPMTIRELMFHMMNNPDTAAIGGIYCLKTEKPEPIVFRGAGTGPYYDWRIGEVFEVSGIGMGATLIRTKVFEDLTEPWFQTVDDMSKFLDNIPYGETWTEDLYFCKKIVDTKKWKVMAHGGLVLSHYDVVTGRAYTMPSDCKPMRHLSSKRGTKKIIDIGCGLPFQHYTTDEGKVFTVDIRDSAEADYRCDFRKLPFATGEFDIVYSSNTLEHVARSEVDDVLKEWIRILKPNGELRLVLPDLKWAFRNILDGTADSHSYSVIYGEQAYSEDFHKCGFTDDVISDLLKKHGFGYVSVTANSFFLYVRAWRRKPREEVKPCPFPSVVDKYKDDKFIHKTVEVKRGKDAGSAGEKRKGR